MMTSQERDSWGQGLGCSTIAMMTSPGRGQGASMGVKGWGSTIAMTMGPGTLVMSTEDIEDIGIAFH